MHSSADLVQHLALLSAAHTAHLSHISDVGRVVAQEHDAKRSAADSEPLRDQIEGYVPELPAGADSAG